MLMFCMRRVNCLCVILSTEQNIQQMCRSLAKPNDDGDDGAAAAAAVVATEPP